MEVDDRLTGWRPSSEGQPLIYNHQFLCQLNRSDFCCSCFSKSSIFKRAFILKGRIVIKQGSQLLYDSLISLFFIFTIDTFYTITMGNVINLLAGNKYQRAKI